ncbi:hypothetical protein GCM10009079_27300 [Ralstonia mannitolilytica]
MPEIGGKGNSFPVSVSDAARQPPVSTAASEAVAGAASTAERIVFKIRWAIDAHVDPSVAARF